MAPASEVGRAHAKLPAEIKRTRRQSHETFDREERADWREHRFKRSTWRHAERMDDCGVGVVAALRSREKSQQDNE